MDEDRLDTGEKDQNVYDVLRFVYQWNKDDIGKDQGWECTDGHADPFDGDLTKKPEIFYIIKNGGMSIKVDSFLDDTDQDCVVIQEESSVVIDDNEFATFTVRFFRPLVTRGRISDALLEVGETVQIHWMFKQSVGWVKDFHSSQDTKITIKSQATMLTQCVTFVSLLLISFLAI